MSMTIEEYRLLTEEDRMRLRVNALAQVAMLPSVKVIHEAAEADGTSRHHLDRAVPKGAGMHHSPAASKPSGKHKTSNKKVPGHTAKRSGGKKRSGTG